MNSMRKLIVLNRNLRNLIVAALLVMAGLIVSDIVYRSDFKYSWEARVFNKQLNKREKQGADCIKRMSVEMQSDAESFNLAIDNSRELGYALAYYEDGTLSLWSDNTFYLPEKYSPSDFDKPFVHLGNHWFVVNRLEDRDDIYICLIKVFNQYGIINDYIKPGFEKSLGLPEATTLSVNEAEGYPVYNSEDVFLFSLVFDKEKSFYTFVITIPLLMWILLVVILMIIVDRWAKNLYINEKGGYAFF